MAKQQHEVVSLKALQDRLDALEEENAKLRKARGGQAGITMKVSATARALSVYGLQRRPVTLYASQWLRLIDPAVMDKLRTFIADNINSFAWKDDEIPSAEDVRSALEEHTEV